MRKLDVLNYQAMHAIGEWEPNYFTLYFYVKILALSSFWIGTLSMTWSYFDHVI
jgi:hypothetical protein